MLIECGNGVVYKDAPGRTFEIMKYGAGKKKAARGDVAAADCDIKGFFGILVFQTLALQFETSAPLGAGLWFVGRCL